MTAKTITAYRDHSYGWQTDWQIDYLAPGNQFWEENIATVVDKDANDAAEVAALYRMSYGHEYGLGKFRAVKLVPGVPLGGK